MTTHPDLGVVAELADGTLPPEAARELRAHMVQCRSCTAAYVDAVRYRAAWLADPDAFRPDPRTLEWAGIRAPSTPHARKRITPVIQWSAVTLLVVCLGLFRLGGRAPSLGFELPPAIRDATERSSARGLVLPGGVEGADLTPPEVRSGQGTDSPMLDREVRLAIDAYEHDRASADAGARVVAALLATNEIDAAREYARECVPRSPNHVPLLVFAADACYRSNDMAGAETLLRHAMSRAPGDPMVALDLALVQGPLGHPEEARLLLVRVARSSQGRLAARAARELARARAG